MVAEGSIRLGILKDGHRWGNGTKTADAPYEAFRRSCEGLPSSVVTKAIRSASAFAVHDKTILKHTKGLERLQGYFRIRIGLHYRMLVRMNSDTTLEILDLIPRENLETWIKQRAR